MTLNAFGDQPNRPEAGFDDDNLAGLDRFAADARLDEAVAARARERWHRQLSSDELTLAGVLDDLGERADTVQVTTTAGVTHRGAITASGADFISVNVGNGHHLLVPEWGLASVRTSGARPAGDRLPSATRPHFADVLLTLAAERPRVSARLGVALDAVNGELVGAGPDVAVVRSEDGSGNVSYLRLRSVAEVLVLAMVSG